ncbi:MAG: SUI1 family translation initiation factor [Thermoplasmatota archaeon]
MGNTFRDIERELGIADMLDADASDVQVRVENRRYGKSVTVIAGFAEHVDLNDLTRELKRSLGTGGTTKEGRIELQGDHRRTARDWLSAHGYRLAAHT